MIVGLDFLGLGHKLWPLQDSIEAFPQGWALGTFARAFGDSLPKVEAFLQSGKVSLLRVHAWWDDDHRPAKLEWLRKELPRWQALAERYPSVAFAMSDSCEYRSKKKAEVEKRHDLTKELCPCWGLVQCPEGGSVKADDVVVEKHGQKAVAKHEQFISSDGHEIQQMDAVEYLRVNKDAFATFLWGARFNLREGGETPPRPKRKAAPNLRYIKSIAALGFPKESPPKSVFDGDLLVMKKPYLYKTHGEDGPGNKDPRENEPVAILPKKLDGVTVFDCMGQRVCLFPRFPDQNPHTTERYYSGWNGGDHLYGYEIAERAKEQSGSPYVYLRMSGKFYRVHPTFRSPWYPVFK